MDFMSFVWLWLSLSIIAGGVASIKGHSFIKYFILSILLSPVILIIFALVTQPNRATMEKRMIAAGEGKKCPYCAEVIKTEAKVCRYCGRALAEAVPSKESEDSNWVCPVCGEESDGSSNICWKCKEQRI